jgi:hypothetical protein
LPVQDKGISHTEYFKQKGIVLKYPGAKPMVVVLGRHDKKIFLPAELVSGTELEPLVCEMLPQIASFPPEKRNQAIEEIKRYLKPGSQGSANGALMPSLGIILGGNRIQVGCVCLSVPTLMAHGVTILKHSAENWAPVLSRANFNIDPNKAVTYKVVVVYSAQLREDSTGKVYEKIRDLVNKPNARYRF